MIAYEASAIGSGTDSATVTLTTVGINQIVWAYINILPAGALSAVTCDGNAMTLADTNDLSDARQSLYFYVGTTAGSRAVTATGTGTIYVQATQYSGASQTGQPDAHTNNSGTSPLTTSVTTVADNCWTVLGARSVTVTITASTGTTQRNSSAGLMGDSNGALTPAGSKSMTVTFASGTAYSLMASFAPASVSNTGFFQFM